MHGLQRLFNVVAGVLSKENLNYKTSYQQRDHKEFS